MATVRGISCIIHLHKRYQKATAMTKPAKTILNP